mmetsp:Transcript_833/g.708  ORF Transcript_833/g.708 Transcript_833/m.708 type:complete len:143 (+) Transcript_833:205-633(+)
MDRYKQTTSPTSGKNILLENKGKVKNLDKFKIELQSYPSCRIPILEPSERFHKSKVQTGFTEIRGYQTNIASSRAISSGKDALYKDVFNFNIKKNPETHNHPLDNLKEGGDKRKIFKQARSVSRKISSTKLLHLLMKSSFDS